VSHRAVTAVEQLPTCVEGDRCSVIDSEDSTSAFKIPQKRRLKQRHDVGKQAKKWMIVVVSMSQSQTDTEGESDSSECNSISCSLPQSDLSSRSYSAEVFS